ncbi:PREDICTED: pectinesterase inhibitor-like [Camelina sativa]|uniref:Pectinesterase inhibitor-like n=1 Tax=Camelina sativa TaxID=90675 RepID=A0ABM0VHE4_CAMSA|nr:PREDICTED: pectinesterase inhibitor-like [Camelina sativa]
MIKCLLLTILVISPISICAKKDLMINECHNTQVPSICMQCLESDPTSVQANPVGIAGIILQCLDAHLHIIINNITDLSSKKDEGEVKTALEVCKKDLSMNVATNLSEAKRSLKTGDYDKVNHLIELALGFPLQCLFKLKLVKFMSPQLSSQINIYGQLSDAAMRIIDRF